MPPSTSPSPSAITRRAWPPNRLAVLAQKLDAAKRQIGTLTIHVSADGARVLVDGMEIGRSPLAEDIYVEPGQRTITAELAGHADARALVEARAGSSETLSLTLETLPAPVTPATAAPAVPPPAPRERTALPPKGLDGGIAREARRSDAPPERPLWPIAVGVPATVVFLTGGIVLTAMANAKRGEITTGQATVDASGGRCGAGADPSACANLDGAVSSRNHLRDAAVAGFVGAGVAALATPILFFWVAPPAASARKESHVAPVVEAERGRVGIGFRGAF